MGAMNIYAHCKAAFNERASEIGELFAVPAAIAVQNAQVISQTKRLAAQLRAALNSRATNPPGGLTPTEHALVYLSTFTLDGAATGLGAASISCEYATRTNLTARGSL